MTLEQNFPLTVSSKLLGDLSVQVELPRFVALATEPVARGGSTAILRRELSSIPSRTVAHRRSAFVAGRRAAHRALEAIGLDAGPILRGVAREPIWPEGAVGSIAHAGHWALALAAPSVQTDGVGVDIERRQVVSDVAEFVAREDERSILESLRGEALEDAVLAMFSAKEAIYKALFPRVGRYFGFSAASLRPATGGFIARLAEDLDPVYRLDTEIEVKSAQVGEHLISWVVLPKTAHP